MGDIDGYHKTSIALTLYRFPSPNKENSFFLLCLHQKGQVPYNIEKFKSFSRLTCWERADSLALLCVVFSCVLSLSHMMSRPSRVRCGT